MLNYRVLTASGGQEALALLEQRGGQYVVAGSFCTKPVLGYNIRAVSAALADQMIGGKK